VDLLNTFKTAQQGGCAWNNHILPPDHSSLPGSHRCAVAPIYCTSGSTKRPTVTCDYSGIEAVLGRHDRSIFHNATRASSRKTKPRRSGVCV